MLNYETSTYEDGRLVEYKSICYASSREAELAPFEDVDLYPELFPFADLSNHELQVINPPDYMEHNGLVAYGGFWYPIDDGEELWFPLKDPGGSSFFVDDTDPLPFADVTDAELRSMYPRYDPLVYEDPWQDEVYDMEYLE